VALFRAENDPSLLNDLILTSGRMWAAVIAILFTVLIPMLLHASHPPAAATTLLITLGAIKTVTEGIYLMIGVIILALFGELLRRARIGKMAISKGEPRYPSPGTNLP
jgi:fumarate reductase subunit D